jgi:hypothetical protein
VNSDLKAGDRVLINGKGDLMMDRDLGMHVGDVVRVVRQQKSGLCEVQTSDGVKAFPRRNLDKLDG